MTKRALAPLLLVLPLLAACVTPNGGNGGSVEDSTDAAAVLREALATHQASIAGIAPRPAAAGGETGEPPPPRPAARQQPATGEPPAMAGQLVGQTPDVVTRLLGEPRLRREEGGAEIWHYQATLCHLDLVLYREEGPALTLRVAFAAARAVGTARRGEAACLRDIARGAAARPSPAVVVEQAEAGA